MNDTVIKEFTTDAFFDMNEDAKVQILNSQIDGRVTGEQIMPTKIKSLDFINIHKFEMYKETIYVVGADQVVFDNCNLKVNDEYVIDISATKVFIKNSILRLNSKGENINSISKFLK